MKQVVILPIGQQEWKPPTCQKPGCGLKPHFWREVTSRRTNRWGYIKPVVRRYAMCIGHAGRIA